MAVMEEYPSLGLTAERLGININAIGQRLRGAVRRGRIARPKVCVDCGGCGKIEAHHRDYAKPFDVVWLCQGCHCRRHKGGEPVTYGNIPLLYDYGTRRWDKPKA